MYHSPATLSFLRNMNEEQKPPWENDEMVFIAKLCFFTCQLSVIQDRFGKGLISEIISDFVYSNRVTRYLMSAVKRRMFWNKYVNKQGNVHIFESCSFSRRKNSEESITFIFQVYYSNLHQCFPEGKFPPQAKLQKKIKCVFSWKISWN